MFDLISIGDSVIDTFVPLIEAGVENVGQERRLVMGYGIKVPVGPSVSTVAGNAANNAVGAARLGLKTAIYTNVGNKDDDASDDRIKAKLKKERVDLRYVVETADLPSNHNIILTFKGERTILTYHQPWKFNLPELERARWVYLTSLAPSFVESNLIDQVTNYLERSGAKLCYNPGTFQIKVGVKKYPRLLSLTEVLIVNLTEAKLILGVPVSKKAALKKLIKGLVDLGPKKVIVTDGSRGSDGFDGERYFHLGVFPAKLLETTGAGDAYATGVLAGLSQGESFETAMRWGAANSASVVEQIGSQAGLLTSTQMQERLKIYSTTVAKEI